MGLMTSYSMLDWLGRRYYYQLMFTISQLLKRGIRYTYATKRYQKSPQYQLFFQDIQKASNPWQVNKVYQKHTKDLDKSVQQQYLPVVLRVFTRLINQDMNVVQYISSFIKREQPRMTSISIRSMDIEQVKDILLFFYKFTKFHPVVHPSLQVLIQSSLEGFLDRTADVKQYKYQNYMSVLLSCVKLVNVYHPQLENKYFASIIQYIQSSNSFFSSAGFTLLNMLTIIRDIYDPNKQHHLAFVHCLFNNLHKSVQSNELLIETQIAIYLSASVIKKRNNLINHNQNSLYNITALLEDRLSSNMLSYSQNQLEILIQGLVMWFQESRLLSKFYNVINLCLSEAGEAKINPHIIIHFMMMLSQAQFVKYFDQSWQQRFIKMLRIYFNQSNNFRRPINEELIQIIQRAYFDQEHTNKLYSFYLNNYRFSKEIKTISKVYLMIDEILLHTVCNNQQAAISSLKELDLTIQKMMKSWFPTVNVDKKYLYFLVNFPRIFSLLQSENQDKINISKDIKVDVAEKDLFIHLAYIKAKLFALQVKLACFLQHNQTVPLLFKQLQQTKLWGHQLLKILKALLTVDYSKDNAEIFYSTFKKLIEKERMCFFEEVYNIVYPQITRQQKCSRETAKILNFIFEESRNELIGTLLKMTPVKKSLETVVNKNGSVSKEKDLF